MIDYDPHQWRTTFFAVRGSMLRAILARVSIVMAFACGITALHYSGHPMSIPDTLTVHGIVGPVLGLLLVFRTNSSYDRWWEGRKLWGTIVNESRNLARSASVHLASDPDRLKRVLQLACAWPYASKERLRLQEHVAQGLDPRDEETLKNAEHLPTAISQRITFLLDEARRAGTMPDIVFTMIDQNNQILVDCIGACERIHKTPLPFAYVVHLRRAMVLFCGSLPFALLHRFGPWTILITLLVTYIMFGIEEIGVEIEDPFEIDDNDLPLDRICDAIKANVSEFLPKA